MRFERFLQFVAKLGTTLASYERAEVLSQWMEMQLEARRFRGVDEVHRRQILAALQRCGASDQQRTYAALLLPSPHLPAMSTGEAWLLLAGAEGGFVTRMQARRPGHQEEGLTLLPDSQVALAEASEGLLRSLADLGMGGPRQSSISLGIARVDDFVMPDQVTGASLGLATCIAHLSAWTEQPTLAHVVGSAIVDARGNLHKVHNIREKIEALRLRWPMVTHLVVASDQTDAPEDQGVTVIHCDSLEQAWGHFGLSLNGVLAPLPVDELRSRIDRLPLERSNIGDRETWSKLALDALSWSAAIEIVLRSADLPQQGVDDLRSYQFKALGFAALFALQAGDTRAASRHLDALDAMIQRGEARWDDVELEVRVSVAITQAGAAIARQTDALGHAREAVKLAEGLGGRLRRRLLGKAIGTLGRAILHGGDPAGACDTLREAVQFQRTNEPEEEARSLCYVATAVRMAGDPAAALVQVLTGLELTAKRSVFLSSRTTRMYLHLEKGRCELALGRWPDALASFDVVIGEGRRGPTEETEERPKRDHDYPKLGALRGRASALYEMGSRRTALAYWKRCLMVAEAESNGTATGQIAALALADLRLTGDVELYRDLDAQIASAWNRHWGMDADEERMRQTVHRAVY